MFSSNANAQKPRNNFGVAAPVNNTRSNSAAPNVPVNTNANATRPNNSANAAAPMTMSQSGGRKKTRKNRKESRKSKKSKRGCRK